MNFVDSNGLLVFAGAAALGYVSYTAVMAMADLTIALVAGQIISNTINSEDDWHDKVDYDNWPLGQEFFYPKDPDPREEKRKKDEEECFAQCVDTLGGDSCGQGFEFTNCMKDCMERRGFTYP